ncbi:MAG: hypothetical protein HQL41_10290 [Alphaproteobacteria bacterium]|nr:hypothetical protein [Alphaproteobacteria bacterium]
MSSLNTVARIKHVGETMRAKYQLTPLVSDDRAGNRILAALVGDLASGRVAFRTGQRRRHPG